MLIHFMKRLKLSSAEVKTQEYILQCGKHRGFCRFKGLSTYRNNDLLIYFFSTKEWSDWSSPSKYAQSPAGVEEGRGDSPENQNHVTRPTEQVEGMKTCHSIVGGCV